MAFRFRDFKVYQDARFIHKELIKLVIKFPPNNFYLIDQIKRSSLSIILNIAEGSSKQSDKDFNRYISISLGSVDETIACLEVALDLKLISRETFSYFEKHYESVCRQLGGFSKALKKK